MKHCDPLGSACSQNFTESFFNCSVSCRGFYGDVWQEIVDREEFEKDQAVLEDLETEYDAMKARLARNLIFHSTSPKFSKLELADNYLTYLFSKSPSVCAPSAGADLL